MSSRTRLRSALLGLLVLLGTSLVLPAPVAAVPADTGIATTDFATERWGDPWDYSNSDDVLLDQGPAVNLVGARVSGGVLSFDLSEGGFFSPLWPGYPGSLYLGRDGLAPQNRIDADRFTRLSFSMYSSAASDVPAGVHWFGGVDGETRGGQPIPVRPGWNTYDVGLANHGYAGPQEWAGAISGLRLALTPSSPTHFAVDWMRLYEPGPSIAVPANAVWDVDDDPRDNRPSNPGWGEVPCTPACDLSSLPPGTYWIVEDGEHTGPVVLRRPAAPVVLDPDAVGGEEYAASDPWDFSTAGDVLETGNAEVISYGDRITARNAGPTTNDPFVWLRLRSPTLDSARFHRLTVRSGYEGDFDLSQGTMARVVWRPSDGMDVQQTNDIVTYSGTRTLTLDLNDPNVHEPEAGPPRAWAEVPVSGLRWDPNEDHGPRTWTLERLAVRADDEAGTSFDIRWYDAGFAPGSRVTIYRQDEQTGAGRVVIPGAEDLEQQPGTNRFYWSTGDAASTPPGTYWIAVEVTGPAGSATSVSSGPVRVVGGSMSGQGASPAAPLVRDLDDACPQSRVPEDDYSDVPPSNVHESAIDCLAWWGVTVQRGSYGPTGEVTRGQMASFLRRAIELTGGDVPDAMTDHFEDDDGTTHEDNINALAEAGLVSGFSDGRYQQHVSVSRAQMASFLVRAAEFRAERELVETANYFSDDATSVHQVSINKAAGAGIANGSGDESYNPAPAVRRDQMANFLVRLLDLLVSSNQGAPPVR